MEPRLRSDFLVRNRVQCLLRFWTRLICHPRLEARSADSKVADAMIKADTTLTSALLDRLLHHAETSVRDTVSTPLY
jgi:hypothetical protein